VLDFRLLGPLEVVGERGPISLGGPKQRATLAILLLAANRVVPVERLADDLYRGAAPVTAVTQVQRQVSELRRLLGDESQIETRPPGYLIRVAAGQLDLHRFEALAQQAADVSALGDGRRALALLQEALGLWRGDALADLRDEPFARPAADRLEEIRLAAVERRLDAELALGRHAELVGELRELARAHPLSERFRAQLMLALYRAGRQAEALQAYREARDTLVGEFGIEPTPALRGLERAILTQDATLEPEAVSDLQAQQAARPVLALPSDESAVDTLLAVAVPLARRSDRELIVTRMLADDDQLARAAESLNERRARADVSLRTAAFTTGRWAEDAVRLAAAYDVALVLLDAPPELPSGTLPDDVAELLDRSPADVGFLAGGQLDWSAGQGIFVPFGGGPHDWAALELAAWLGAAVGVSLRLVGTRADPVHGRRDASRLLADAALAVQRFAGVPSQPLLADASEDALVAALEGATIVIEGISPRWRQDGIGATRRAVLERVQAPALLVHGGARPGGLAPDNARTRFTWSIQAHSG
jgi:DNA-binding SARP family transcriptional activator